MDYTSRHPVPLDSQKKTLTKQGRDDDDEVVVNRVMQDNLSGAVREETDKDPVLSKVNQQLRDHEQDLSDKTLFRYNKRWLSGLVVRGHRVVITTTLRLQ